MADNLKRLEEKQENEGKVCIFFCSILMQKCGPASVHSPNHYFYFKYPDEHLFTSRPAFYIRLFLGEIQQQMNLRQRLQQVEGEMSPRGPFAQIGLCAA